MKNYLKTIQKIFWSIVAIQKYGDKKIYTLVVENLQYSVDVSWNVSVWSCSLSKRLLIAGPDQSTDTSDSHPSLLKAEVVDRAACYVFVIYCFLLISVIQLTLSPGHNGSVQSLGLRSLVRTDQYVKYYLLDQ